MVYEEIYLQIFLFAFGMVVLSLLLNKLLGIKPGIMLEVRDKAKNLQERMKNAQVLGDMRMMQELQQETMQLMKLMLKKQVGPMCLRCVIFWVIFGIVGIFYVNYGFGSQFFFGLGWPIYYLLLAFGLSFSIMGLKKYYYKKTGKEGKTTSFMKEMSQILNFRSIHPESGTFYQMPTQSTPVPKQIDAWKNKIQKFPEEEQEEDQEEEEEERSLRYA